MGALTSCAGGAGSPVEPIAQPWLLQVDAAATAVFTLAAIAAVVAGGVWVTVLVVVSAVLFVAGSIGCLWAFAIAVQRSRYVEIAPTQLYFLTGGCAPAVVRNRFLSLFAIQVEDLIDRYAEDEEVGAWIRRIQATSASPQEKAE